MAATIGKSGSASVKVEIPTLLETRALIQAQSGGGKSWVLRRLLEQTAGEVQQLIIDPDGEFQSLREKYDYIVCAPHDADAIAQPRTAKLLALRLLESGVSAVLDIYDLKAYERQTFVKIFLETLVNAPKKLWHPVLVVLDEAHIFAPERGKAESRGAVIDIATRGRKRGQCLVAATQRLSKLHKDVAAECRNKLIGQTGLDIDVARAADELGIGKRQAWNELRAFDPGEFYCFGPAISKTVTKVRVGKVVTTHPQPGQRTMTAPPKPSAKIRSALAKLSDLPAEAEKEARTLEEYRSEIAQLKSRLTTAEKRAAAAGVPEAEVRRREKAAAAAARNDASTAVNGEEIRQAIKYLERAHQVLMGMIGANQALLGVSVQENGGVTAPASGHRNFAAAKLDKLAGKGAAADISGIKKGAVRILQELAARYPAGYTRSQVGALTRFSPKGGTFNTYLGSLRRAGFIEERENLVYATEAGIEALGDKVPAAPKTHEEAMDQWRAALKAGAFRMLEAIVLAGQSGISREGVAVAVDMERTGGTFNTYLGTLRRNGLIVESDGRVYANSILYPES